MALHYIYIFNSNACLYKNSYIYFEQLIFILCECWSQSKWLAIIGQAHTCSHNELYYGELGNETSSRMSAYEIYRIMNSIIRLLVYLGQTVGQTVGRKETSLTTHLCNISLFFLPGRGAVCSPLFSYLDSCLSFDLFCSAECCQGKRRGLRDCSKLLYSWHVLTVTDCLGTRGLVYQRMSNHKERESIPQGQMPRLLFFIV